MVEGQDLNGYLMDLFSTWVGYEAKTKVSITSAFQIGSLKTAAMYPRDIIVKFPYWETKLNILESHWEQPDITIDGKSVSIFPDLSSITLRKSRH